MASNRSIRLRSIRKFRFKDVIAKVLETPLPARVQRLGDQALKRVSSRFPGVEKLIDLGGRSLREGIGAALLDRLGVSWPLETEAPTDADASSEPAASTAAAASEPAGTNADPGPSEEESLLALQQGLTEGDWRLRCGAIARYGAGSGPGGAQPLIWALDDPSAEVAASACEALSQLAASLGGDTASSAVTALSQVLANEQGYYSPVSRAAAAHGLTLCISSSESPGDDVSRLLDDAINDMDAEVSLAVIAALSELLPDEACPRLLRLLRDQTGFFLPLVRRAAAVALVDTQRCDADTLAELARVESDPDVLEVLRGAAEAA